MDEDGRLRVAVIGIGQRAEIAEHVGGTATPAVLVAAVDTTEEGRRRAAERFGPTVRIADEVDPATIDAAIVTTPDDTHASIALPLLEAGVAVYLEKPMAITVADCDRLLETAARTGTPLYVGHNMRHLSVVKQMKALIDAGAIGDVKAIWCRHFVGHGGDFYFRDWHAERAKVHSLLLQKASHDIDVIHWLAGRTTRRVTALGALAVYGDPANRRPAGGTGAGLMHDWFSLDHWPPDEQRDLNPVVDVEDVSMMLMDLGDGVTASYQQCHFTPDYWRNYTVIGTRGRLENFGDTPGGVIRVWNRRHDWAPIGDVEVPIAGEGEGHEEADALTMSEFLHHVATGAPTAISPLAARAAVAAGALAAESLRNGGVPRDVPPPPP